MALQIRLVDQIDPILIAELIPSRLVGIVAGTDRIDVVALHETDIPDHVFFRDGASSLHIELMTVNSAEHDSFPV